MNYSLFFALLSICSRGLAECFLPKSLSYLASLGSFFFFVICFYASCRPVLVLRPAAIIISIAFVISSIASLLFTLADGADSAYGFYLAYPIAISFFFLMFYSIKVKSVDLRKVERAVSALVLVLFVMATLQEFKVIDLPGATPAYGLPVDLARPSSLTGSYLHYPLIMVMLGVFLQAINQRVTFVSLIAFSSVFLAFSRSGMMLVFAHFSFLIVYNILTNGFRFSLKGLLVFYFSLLTGIVAMVASGFLELFIERISSSFDQQGVGNDDRIEAWRHGLEVFSSGDWWFGNNFGIATNLTANLVGADSYVVESAVLQNLINFGIVGSIIFFCFFGYMYFFSKERVFRFFLLAFIFQSLVYQSTEVLPFILGVLFLRSLDIQRPASFRASVEAMRQE
ncbi:MULTISPECIES: O-antigen ligase family protein [Pseudomonas]|uniref:O-antigen ligase domain-containing protein n=1 Tax=Pseudomonas fluorescens TaxID=294 RepID=A0A5E6TZG0_PSEFL|nr:MULTISPECIES: O-antigen ligase family protein [Pseudomonas]VVM98864.1 hypothetical protein PS652_03183 [Pseudomonas fluorescens]